MSETGLLVRCDDTAQTARKELGVCSPLSGPGVKSSQLNPANRSMNVCHAVVVPHKLVFVLGFHPLIPEQPYASRNLPIRAGNHSAFTTCHILGRVQAEHAKHSKRPDFLTMGFSTVRLGRILKNGNPISFSNANQFGHVNRMSKKMNWHDSFSPRGD
jgi:hypothetical protein